MMTFAQFKRLKPGDILLMRSKRGPYKRTIVDSSDYEAMKPSHAHVTFPIKRRSWTNRARTSYSFVDLKHKIIRKVGHTTKLCTGMEVQELKDIGFNPRREMLREVREEAARKLRMGRSLCQRKFQLPST